MDYCGPLGLPRSQFLAWARDDQDYAIEWSRRKRATCSSCGTREDEWDPSLGGRDNAYRAELRKCWGCDAVASMQSQIRSDMGAGVTVALVPYEEA